MNQGEWKISCVGTLERIEEQDLDKTKRHPKIKIVLHVRPSEMQASIEGVEMPEEIRFGAMERDYWKLVGAETEPQEGDLVAVEGIATGVRPTYCVLEGVRVFTTH